MDSSLTIVLLLLALIWYDALLSWIMLSKKTATEINPVMRFLIDKVKLVPAIVGSRAILSAAVWFVPSAAPILLPFYGVVGIWNTVQWYKSR